MFRRLAWMGVNYYKGFCCAGVVFGFGIGLDGRQGQGVFVGVMFWGWPGWASGSRGLCRCYVLGLAWMGARRCDMSRSRQKLKYHVFPKLAMSHCVLLCMKMNFSCSFSEEISRLRKSINSIPDCWAAFDC